MCEYTCPTVILCYLGVCRWLGGRFFFLWRGDDWGFGFEVDGGEFGMEILSRVRFV